MKIVVTGGAGFIGSHLADKLIEKGHNILVIDNLSSGKEKNINSKAKFIKVDILDPKISKIFQKEKPEIVFHYAGQISVERSAKNLMNDAKNNILGTLNVLDACAKNGIKKIVFASSAGVYGNLNHLPSKENYSPLPVSPNAIAKLACENYLSFYQEKFGLKFVVLRYSNVYGPRQLANNGGVISIFLKKISKNNPPVIYGTGLQTRDFLYIDDAISATLLASNCKTGSIYNVGINNEISINDLLQKLYKMIGKKIKPTYVKARKEEIINSRIDYSKIKKELNWIPKYNLEKGLKKIMDSYQK